MWTLVETAMKTTTLVGVLAWCALLSRPAPWRAGHWAGLAGGLAGVGLMVENRALEASWGGVVVDALYLGLALAWIVRDARRRARATRALPAEGSGMET